MSDDNPTEQPAPVFQGWTPFAVMFRADGSVASLVGPDEGDPYSLLGNGDVWAYNAGDETDGGWITNVDLSIESGIIAGRAAAAFNALLSITPADGESPQPELIVSRLMTFVGLWTRSQLNEYILRELSCDFLISIAGLIAVVDRGAALDLLQQHSEAAEGEWTEPGLCRCKTIAIQIQTSDDWTTPWETHEPGDR